MANLLPFSAFSPAANTDMVLYDTNMAVALVGSTTDPRFLEARSFTATLTTNKVPIITSIKLHEELRLLGTSQTLGGRKKQKATLATNPAAIAPAVAWAQVAELRKYPTVYPDPVGEINNDLLNQATDLMRNYGLQWGDAVHLAIAYKEQINCIATLDGDFSRVTDSNLVIYTDSIMYGKSRGLPPAAGGQGT